MNESVARSIPFGRGSGAYSPFAGLLDIPIATGKCGSSLNQPFPQKTSASPSITVEDARQLEATVTELLTWFQTLTTKREISMPLEVEHDVWAQLPPKQAFTIQARIQNRGRAKPTFFADWTEED